MRTHLGWGWAITGVALTSGGLAAVAWLTRPTATLGELTTEHSVCLIGSACGQVSEPPSAEPKRLVLAEPGIIPLTRPGTDVDEGPELPPPPPEPIDLSVYTDLPPALQPQTEEPPLAETIRPVGLQTTTAKPVLPYNPSALDEPETLPANLDATAVPQRMPYSDEPCAVMPGGCAGAIMEPESKVVPATFTSTSRKVSLDDLTPVDDKAPRKPAGIDTMECRPADLVLPDVSAAKPY